MKSKENRAMGAQMNAERVAAGLTQQELADASGINIETMKRILKGTRDINVTQIAAVAKAVHLLPEQLVARATDRLEQMSQAPATSDDLAERRKKQKEAASMSSREMSAGDAAALGLDEELNPDRDDDPTVPAT